MDIVQHPTQARALVFTGSPAEFAEFVNTNPDDLIEFGGLGVGSKVTESKHDGQPAFGFELTDSAGVRSVGRLVLMDTKQQRDERPEWVSYYETENEALENLAIFTARSSAPSVITHQVDWTYEDETLEESLAELSARFGVSVKVLDPRGPGGGWPVIEVTGKYANVERWLKSQDDYGYHYDDEDMREFFYNV